MRLREVGEVATRMVPNMKRFNLLLVTFLFLLGSAVVIAQDEGPSASEQAATLRLQLVDIQGKEGDLQLRVQQLDEDLKPENIERATSGYGSTRPEELREQRRKQLELEKKTALAQLEQLAISRTRLEAAIANADALAYQQSAKGYPIDQVSGSKTELRGILIAGAIAAVGVMGLLLLVRRYLRNQV
jgi:hypothetical protein